MNRKIVSIIVIICIVIAFQFCLASEDGKADSEQKDSGLQVYLPREITIKDNTIHLGEVSIIRGDKSLTAKANEIALGQMSMPGQEVVVDRQTILSRLACNGIPESKVTLSGAEKISVKQHQRIIKGEEFVKIAASFLERNYSSGSIYQCELVQTAADLVIDGKEKDIKLLPHLVGGNAENQGRVRIVVLANGKETGTREVAFRLKYNCRQVVTTADIPANTAISPENVRIEKTISDHPEPAGWSPPYELTAKRRLPSNTIIRPDMVETAKPAVIVKRNQTVAIRIENPGILITAAGKTMQDGRAGEYIKVRNLDSQRIILAKVNEDGTVEPVL